MQSQWSNWLAAEAAAGRGGIPWPEPIVRGYAFQILLPVPLDLTGYTVDAEVRLSPQAPGPALATFATDVGSFTGGTTLVTLDLTAADTGSAGSLPADGDSDGLAEVVCDIIFTPATGAPFRAAALVLLISGRVTEPA